MPAEQRRTEVGTLGRKFSGRNRFGELIRGTDSAAAELKDLRPRFLQTRLTDIEEVRCQALIPL